jgi:hypothetical protein
LLDQSSVISWSLRAIHALEDRPLKLRENIGALSTLVGYCKHIGEERLLEEDADAFADHGKSFTQMEYMRPPRKFLGAAGTLTGEEFRAAELEARVRHCVDSRDSFSPTARITFAPVYRLGRE